MVRPLLLAVPPLVTLVTFHASLALSDWMARRQLLLPTMFFLTFPVFIASVTAILVGDELLPHSVLMSRLTAALETVVAWVMWGLLLTTADVGWK